MIPIQWMPGGAAGAHGLPVVIHAVQMVPTPGPGSVMHPQLSTVERNALVAAI